MTTGETPKDKAAASFRAIFEVAPEHFFQAPGRVNLIGEHTDYNDGFVLPVAISFQTVVAASRRADRTVRLVAADYDNRQDQFSLDASLEPHGSQLWANYVRGVINGLLEKGFNIGGANIAISGNVPQGAGLSSSAALEVVIGQTFKSLFNLDISQTELALIGQEAEHEFVGTKCGIMDQLVSAEATEGNALLIDCRSLETISVPIPEDLAILIIDSNVTRGLVDSEYNARREQCEEAARLLGVKALRDITLADLEERLHELPPVVARRARHVVSENARTLEAAEALAQGDITRLSHLMAASHASMRDDFEITVPAIDFIVETIGLVVGDKGGVRMTGGGFGGCVVALLPPALIPDVEGALARTYEPETGLKETIHICEGVAGAGEIDDQP